MITKTKKNSSKNNIFSSSFCIFIQNNIFILHCIFHHQNYIILHCIFNHHLPLHHYTVSCILVPGEICSTKTTSGSHQQQVPRRQNSIRSPGRPNLPSLLIVVDTKTRNSMPTPVFLIITTIL